MERLRFPASLLLLPVLLSREAFAALYSFRSCKDDVERILNGTLILGYINNETIGSYIWNGSVQGLSSRLPRSQYLSLTYEGRFSTFQIAAHISRLSSSLLTILRVFYHLRRQGSPQRRTEGSRHCRNLGLSPRHSFQPSL